MNWQSELLDRLAAKPCGGYGRGDSPATEPSALAGLAFAGAGRWAPSQQVATWLAELQSSDGSVGIRATEHTPCWPTSLAVLTWLAQPVDSGTQKFQASIDRGTAWILSNRGLAMPRTKESGHDSTIDAWSWVEKTHSWVEPTALHVLALKAAGRGGHERTRKAVDMLFNRQLSAGGCNYGNTTVFGSELRPHLQPTGIALLALAHETAKDERIKLARVLLAKEISPSTTVVSLCWSLLALAAHGEFLPNGDAWLESAYRRVLRADSSVHKLALIALASQKSNAPIVSLPARFSRPLVSVLPDAGQGCLSYPVQPTLSAACPGVA